MRALLAKRPLAFHALRRETIRVRQVAVIAQMQGRPRMIAHVTGQRVNHVQQRIPTDRPLDRGCALANLDGQIQFGQRDDRQAHQLQLDAQVILLLHVRQFGFAFRDDGRDLGFQRRAAILIRFFQAAFRVFQ